MNKIIVLFAFLLSFGLQAQFNVEHSVYFDTDVYNLTKTEKTRLQKFLSSLTKDEVQKIEIYGFCDDRGSNNYNLELSQNRADAIKTIFGEASFFPEKIVTVEIENINQLKQIIGLKFKRILFDNMSSLQLKKCLKFCKNKYQTEYSGNATLKNIKQISKTGINRISVGAITHSAKSFDTTLLFR